MTALLLDTHVLVWMILASRRVGTHAQRAINRGLDKDGVFVSAVSFYEIARLIEARRLSNRASAWEIRERALREGVTEIPLDGKQAMDAAGLFTLTGDPMDRFIVATARDQGATLVSADEAILGWAGDVLRMDARE